MKCMDGVDQKTPGEAAACSWFSCPDVNVTSEDIIEEPQLKSRKHEKHFSAIIHHYK